jgi:phage terminase small subunit
LEDVTCFSWDKTVKEVNPEWFSAEAFDVVIIDGYCENWDVLVRAYPNTRFIMAMRANTSAAISNELKRSFRIVAKSGFTDKESKTKGILSVRKFKG